jgi:uncharacterized membrane protein YphA (DoxX/SURF4 family)
MNDRLQNPALVLRIAFGLMATLAGLDKFFNILADWGSYVSPLAAQIIPIPTSVLMGTVGVVEFAVGVLILTSWPVIGAYIASAWLMLVAGNLVLGGHFDVAVRDVVLAIAAFTLARLMEVREVAPIRAGARIEPAGHRVTA